MPVKEKKFSYKIQTEVKDEYDQKKAGKKKKK